MRYATADVFRTTLEQRLLARSRSDGLPLTRLRKLVVYDRLLARLLAVAPDRWIVKGGLALDLRFGSKARATKDLDLGREDGDAATTADLEAAAALELDDFLVFTVRRTGRLDAALAGIAVRFQIAALMAERRFEDVQIDVGLHGSAVGEPDRLRGTDLLGFAGIDTIEIPTLPLVHHVAEKVHAYTQTFHDQRNTRIKDLIDLVLIRSSATFHAGNLRRALALTFSAQPGRSLPVAFPSPPAIWERGYAMTAGELGYEPSLDVGHRLAADFLDPVLDNTVTDDARWNPSVGVWQSSGQ